MTDITINSTLRHPRKLHPLALRIMHWVNAIAMIIMIGSGWEIYNDEVLFGWLHFPHWMTVGDGPEGALQWHFFAMWLLMINGHVGNLAPLRCALEIIRSRFDDALVAIRGVAEISARVAAEFFADARDWHANAAETALMLARAPHLVRSGLAPV